MRFADLQERLAAIGDAEDGEMFMGRPDRWWESARWRCLSDHVSTTYLGTDKGARCLECRGPLALTFPEDVDGPLRTTT